MYIFPNYDKDGWNKNEDAHTSVGIRRGSRQILCSPPNGGKTNVLFNKIAQSEPPYELFYVYKVSTKSREYDLINHVAINKIADLPKQDDIIDDRKTLLIMEDMDKIKPKELAILDEFFRYTCSHFGWSVVIVCQHFFSIPRELRLKLDTFILFLTNGDRNILYQIPCVPKEDIVSINNYFKKHGDIHSFITIDSTIKDKYKFNNEEVLKF